MFYGISLRVGMLFIVPVPFKRGDFCVLRNIVKARTTRNVLGHFRQTSESMSAMLGVGEAGATCSKMASVHKGTYTYSLIRLTSEVSVPCTYPRPSLVE